MHIILLLPPMARCLKTIDVCISMAHVGFYLCCNDCVGFCGIICCAGVIVKDSVFQPWSVEGARVWEERAYRYGDVVCCVHHVAGLNAAFCKRRPYGKGILHPVAVSVFIMYRGLCACTEMLRMCVLHV